MTFAADDGLPAWTYTYPGDHFLDWGTASEPPGGVGGFSLAAVANTSGSVDVFATGSSDVIWLSQLSPSHVWSGWSNLG